MSDPISLETSTSAERTAQPSTTPLPESLPIPTAPTAAVEPEVSPPKPLLNPLQSDAPPPSSTIVEPPRSPNPQNLAIDIRGNNVDMDNPSGPGSAVEPPEDVPSAIEPSASVPVPVTAEEAVPVPSESEPVSREDSHPPLPKDAPVPPSPSAADEPPPILPPDAIPPAVPTPTVITLEDGTSAPGTPSAFAGVPAAESTFLQPAAQSLLSEQPPAPSISPSPAPPAIAPEVPAPVAPIEQPTSAPITPAIESAPITPAIETPTETPAPAQAEAEPSSEGMDIDAIGEEEEVIPEPVAQLASTPTTSLKRSGDELEGGEAKRVKEDAAVPFADGTPVLPPAFASTPAVQAPVVVPDTTSVAAPSNLPAPAPASVDAAPVAPVATVPINYVPPPPRPGGPTTPLTITQHKHILGAVRSLKKAKEAVPFLAPVDPVLFNIPHYPTIVTKPMDLGTVEKKLVVSDPRGPPKDKSKMKNWDLTVGTYGSVSDVTADVRQIWENTRMFNGPDHLVSLGANKLEQIYESALTKIPAEPAVASPAPISSPAAAGPSNAHPRRASISQPPVIRRISESTDSRPKREIHPPPPKDLSYADGAGRKPKRRNDPQLQWAMKQLKTLESKHFDTFSPFLYPVEQIIAAIPDYATVIKNPIDLNHIKNRLANGDYDEAVQVNKDMKLLVSNAVKFNPPEDAVYLAAKQVQQLWDEVWKNLPPKELPREESEDPLAEEFVVEEEESDGEDTGTIALLQKQIADLQKRIDEIRAKGKSRRGSKAKAAPSKPKAAPAPRKQSVSKPSPGVNGNGHAKKPRKSKDVSYRDDEDGEESEEETTNLTLTQKQELAEKIQVADGDTLTKAIEIIQQSTNLGANEEIELDIDSLPPATVVKLYNLVCRGGRKPGRPKGQTAVGQGKKPGRKGTGGVSKRSMNEQEEAARIKRMEQQLQNFNSQPTYEESDESSEEEESDEE